MESHSNSADKLTSLATKRAKWTFDGTNGSEVESGVGGEGQVARHVPSIGIRRPNLCLRIVQG